MRILLHGINFSPELTGIGKYTGEMADWLASHGHQVRVVTAPPYYPQWRVADGWPRWRYRVEHRAGADGGSLTVIRCPLWVPARPSGFKRVLHLASFALCSLPAMLAQIVWRPDVVWVVEPALDCAPQALVVARLCGAVAWLHVQDFEVDAAFDLGLLKGRFWRRMIEGVERWLMRRFDHVSTVSNRMLERLQSKGVGEGRRMLFPNWADVGGIRPGPACETLRRELEIPERSIVALYSGNMGAKQGLESLADAARHLDGRAPVVFVLCGEGSARENLVRRCSGLSNVRFMPLQPTERFYAFLNLADIHLLPQRADAADLVMPSRLTSMLASGRPVVAGARDDTEVAAVVSRCGVVVPPEDSRAIADAVMRLAADPELRAHLGRLGRAYAETNLDRDAVLGRFAASLGTGAVG